MNPPGYHRTNLTTVQTQAHGYRLCLPCNNRSSGNCSIKLVPTEPPASSLIVRCCEQTWWRWKLVVMSSRTAAITTLNGSGKDYTRDTLGKTRILNKYHKYCLMVVNAKTIVLNKIYIKACPCIVEDVPDFQKFS